MQLPSAVVGRWTDKKGVQLVIGQRADKTYAASFFDKDGQPFTTTLLDGSHRVSVNMDVHVQKKAEGMCLNVECGARGLGPVYELHIAQDTSGEQMQLVPRIEFGLYDDWDDDHGVAWAYPMTSFYKTSMNQSLEEIKHRLQSMTPRQRLDYGWKLIKQKNTAIRHAPDISLLFLRFLALWIDLVVMFLPMCLFAIPLALYDETWALYGIIPSLLFMPLYFLLRDGIGGAGVGKRVCRLRVIDANSRQPVGFAQSWLRFVGPVLPFLIFEPLILLYLGNRRLGDIVAHTRVVLKRKMQK